MSRPIFDCDSDVVLPWCRLQNVCVVSRQRKLLTLRDCNV